MRTSINSRPRRGGALLAVLWLSAALAAIAFSVATTVRAETERASTLADGVRAYYLATGAIERALLYVGWGRGGNPDPNAPPGPAAYNKNTALMFFPFPTGEAIVEVIPETARLSLNLGRPEDFLRLLMALGMDPVRAQETAAAIVHWRTPGGGGNPFDQYYASRTPSFLARHASFEEVEEALYVKGMTPDIFYGTYARDAAGRLVRQSAFKDCVSVYGTTEKFDLNSVEPALMMSFGIPPPAVQRIVEARRIRPFRSVGDLAAIGVGGPGVNRLGVGGNTIYTLRATARVRRDAQVVSDLRRTVSAQVKLIEGGAHTDRYNVIRWNDNAISGVGPWW